MINNNLEDLDGRKWISTSILNFLRNSWRSCVPWNRLLLCWNSRKTEKRAKNISSCTQQMAAKL